LILSRVHSGVGRPKLHLDCQQEWHDDEHQSENRSI
jgi:hypothetical protein